MLPAPYRTGCPPRTTCDGGSVDASSIGHVSSVESIGGAWKLKMARDGSGRPATTSSIISVSCSSGASRGVFQGVGFTYGRLIMSWSSSSGTTRPSQPTNERVPLHRQRGHDLGQVVVATRHVAADPGRTEAILGHRFHRSQPFTGESLPEGFHRAVVIADGAVDSSSTTVS